MWCKQWIKTPLKCFFFFLYAPIMKPHTTHKGVVSDCHYSLVRICCCFWSRLEESTLLFFIQHFYSMSKIKRVGRRSSEVAPDSSLDVTLCEYVGVHLCDSTFLHIHLTRSASKKPICPCELNTNPTNTAHPLVPTGRLISLAENASVHLFK